MSTPVNSLDFLFPYITFNTARQAYQDAINSWKTVLDEAVANGFTDKPELINYCENISTKISDLNDLIAQLDQDESNALAQFNSAFN